MPTMEALPGGRFSPSSSPRNSTELRGATVSACERLRFSCGWRDDPFAASWRGVGRERAGEVARDVDGEGPEKGPNWGAVFWKGRRAQKFGWRKEGRKETSMEGTQGQGQGQAAATHRVGLAPALVPPLCGTATGAGLSLKP